VRCAVAWVLTGDRWGGVGRVGGGMMVIVGCARPVRILRSWVSSASVRPAWGWGGDVAVVLWGWVALIGACWRIG
jgi:hypothetical protein